MKPFGVILASLLFLGLMPDGMTQENNAFYRISNRYSLPGDYGWDYLVADDSSGRLYVSHGQMVQVLDLASGKLVGTIPDTRGVHGIALAHDLNKGFISCGRDSSVTVFDPGTLKVLDKIRVTGSNPDAILYDKFSKKVFTCNGGSANATVIDAAGDRVLATIMLPGKPEFSVSDGHGKIFINIEDRNLIVAINTQTLTVEQQWPIKPGESPSGLAFDRQNHRLFSVCDNGLMVVVDSQTGEVITTVKIGKNVDGAAFDPVLKRIYSSNGEGTMTVVQEESKDHFSVLTTVPTQRGARTISLSEKTHRLFLPTAEYGPAPEATPENKRPRPSIKPGTFVVLEVEPLK